MSAPEKLEFEEEQNEAGPKVQLSAEQEAQYERITRNLQEVTSAEVLRKVIAEGRTPKAYWGMPIGLLYSRMLTIRYRPDRTT